MEFSRRSVGSRTSRATLPDRHTSSTSNSCNRSSVVRSLNFPRGNPSTSFYSSTSAARSTSTWQPGQHLPVSGSISERHPRDSDIPSTEMEQSSVVEVLQTLQSSIDGQFSQINSTLGEISERLNALESKQQNIEDKIESGYCSVSSTPQSSCSESGSRRKRRTPVSLQNKIHIVHNALDTVNQLRVHEPITSSHNVGVVQKITDDIGLDEYSKDLIPEGCKTYRKSLSEKHKSLSTPTKKKKQIRSLKQRSYERRSRAIKSTSEREKKYWSDVTADMMSDEEKVGDTYVRHPPMYRSERLNRFIHKLDSRLESTPSRHARHARILGSPVEKQTPARAKRWMLKGAETTVASMSTEPDDQNDITGGEGSDQDLFGTSEDEVEDN